MRDLINLIEGYRLPLYSGNIKNYLGSYGNYIIAMHPEDFLRLTTTDQAEYDSIFARPFPKSKEEYLTDRIDQEDAERTVGKYQLPYLNVRYPSGEIKGHEGRHRAAMILRQGGDVIPVAIFLYSETVWEITYKTSNFDTDEENELSEEFLDYKAAEARKKELEAENSNLDRSVYHSRFRLNSLRGGKLKGHPDRSDGWDYSAWTVGDFPKQLHGQYNESVVIPSSCFKIGLMKGAKHYRR